MSKKFVNEDTEKKQFPKKSMKKNLTVKLRNEVRSLKHQFFRPEVYYLGFLLFVFSIILFLISTKYLNILDNDNNEKVMKILKEQPYISVPYICVIGPIFEELLFRKLLFGIIKKKSRVLVYIISPFLFAFSHFQLNFEVLKTYLSTFPYYYLIGMAFTINYDYTGYLLSTCIAHILTNSASVFLLYKVFM